LKIQAPQLAPIGLYDSGVGGLSVVREVLRQLPGEAIHYLADTARVPYGGRPAAELLTFNREILAYLASEGAKAILVACNTSCATALDALRPECPVPVVGLIDAGARAALASGRRIAVLATEATVRSGAYERAIRALDPSADVISLACPGLVPVVEAGHRDDGVAETAVAAALAPLALHEVDAAVLGCTHYPLLADLIGRRLGSGVKLVDPAEEAVRELAWILFERELLAPAGIAPTHQMAVTGDDAHFAGHAAAILGGPEPAVRRIFLETLRLAGNELWPALSAAAEAIR
jgi:glutamate racemase